MITPDKFQITDGLHVGLSISQVKKLRNDFFLEFDELDGQEYFAPKELQTYSGEYFSTLNLLYFVSNDDEPLVENYILKKKLKVYNPPM